MESRRNEDDRICPHNILNVGFLQGVTPVQLNMIQSSLTNRIKNVGDESFDEKGPQRRKDTEEIR